MERSLINIAEARAKLQILRERNDPEKLRGRLTVEDMAQRRLVREQILALEREIAEYSGKEFAAEWNWPVKPGFGREFVLADGLRTYLVYQPVNPDPRAKPGSAILEFSHCVSVKFGTPNDEVIKGHPLFGRGIDVGGAYIVQNSRWLAELKDISRVHTAYNEKAWEAMKHYLLFFKERTFECIADKVSSRVVESSPSVALSEIAQRLSEI